MSKITTISFNAPQDVKSRLQTMADEYGLTISDLMRMSALQIVAKGIVIEPGLEPTPYLEHAIKSAEEDLKAARTTTITNSGQLAKHLARLRK